MLLVHESGIQSLSGSLLLPAPTSPAIEPVERIDFVWARGLEVRNARVLDSLASDHRMVVIVLALP